MNHQQGYNLPSENAGEAANRTFTSPESWLKNAFNLPQYKSYNGNFKKLNVSQKIPVSVHKTSLKLDAELTIGKNTAWNESATNDGDAEQQEHDKMIKRKPIYTEIESEETKKKRITQSLIGDAF